jgi:hypothetical protein
VPVFLPGFKKDRQVEVPVAPARSTEGIVWHTVLHYPSLSERYPSTASALVSLDHHLLRIAFELHTVYGSGRREIVQQDCDRSAVAPAGGGRR